jgi:hypothetical protein
MASSSSGSCPKGQEDEGIMTLRNASNYSPVKTNRYEFRQTQPSFIQV